MGNNLTSFLPRRSLAFIIACSVGIIGFFLLAIYPNQKAVSSLNARIAMTRSQVEEQKIFRPIYEQLREIRIASKDSEKVNLPFTAPQKPSKGEDIHHIRSLLSDIVRESGLEAERIEPDVATMLDGSGHIKVSIAATGAYGNFREFMIRLNDRLPSIESVEHLKIQRVPKAINHRLEMGLWLTQE